MDINDIKGSNLLALARQRWRMLSFLIGCSFLFGIATFAIMPRQYLVTATVIGTRYSNDITPNVQSGSSAAAVLLGTGANDLPAITDFRLYTLLLTSPELGAVIVDDPLMHRIFAKSWRGDHWGPPDTPRQFVMDAVYGAIGQPGWTRPDGFVVANYLSNHLKVDIGKDAKLAKLSTWNKDPELGKNLIKLVHTRADQLVKEMAQKRLQAKVDFLKQVLAETTVQDTRNVLSVALVKAQTDKLYSFTNLPFAAEWLAQPQSPAVPGYPSLGVVLGLFLLAGLLIFFLDLIWILRVGRSPLDRVAGIFNRTPSAPVGHLADAPDR